MAWWLIASVALHLCLVALFLVKLPLPAFDAPPEEEVVSVEMVEETPPEPEKPPEPEPPAEPEEPPPEEAASPPPATMLAVRPPVSDAPEREDATGMTEPAENPAPVETAPETGADEQQEAPLPPAETAASAEEPPEPAPEASETQQALFAQTQEAAGVTGPETDDSLSVPAGEEGVETFAATPERPPLPKPRPSEPPGRLRTAEKMLSSARFADPQAREALGQLPLPKRIVQLCTVEALSQIMAARPHAALHGMVPFGDDGGRIDDGTLEATGGAYRTMSGDWYDVSFRCAVDVKAMRVTGFSYRLGDGRLTRQERLARGLPGN